MPSIINRRKRSRELVISSILIAIGIMIPMVMPIKVVIGPASYTLASHVPIFIALMVSPFVAVSVAAGTTLGFGLSGFPPVIVLRAASHFLFVLAALLLIRRTSFFQKSLLKQLPFAMLINLIHAMGEVAAVYLFSVTSQMTNTEDFWFSLVVLVGLGTFIHGMVDYCLAYLVVKRLPFYKG